MTSQNGDFTMRYSDLSLLPIVSGTAKCLVAPAGPFSEAYLPIFNCPVFSKTKVRLTHSLTCSVSFCERVPHLSTGPTFCSYLSRAKLTATYAYYYGVFSGYPMLPCQQFCCCAPGRRIPQNVLCKAPKHITAWAPCTATGISKIHYSIPAFSPHCQALANSRIRLRLSKSRCPCRHGSLELLFAWSI